MNQPMSLDEIRDMLAAMRPCREEGVQVMPERAEPADRMDRLESKIDRLHEAVAGLIQGMTRLSNDVTELKVNVAGLKGEVAELNVRVTKLEIRVDTGFQVMSARLDEQRQTVNALIPTRIAAIGRDGV